MLTYAITAGNADGAFAINTATGQVTVADGTKLDYETATSRALTVTATDNGSPPLSDLAAVTVNITDVAEAPAAPAGLTATAGPGTVALSWTAAAGAAGYRVYRGTPGGQSATPVVSDLTATTYTDTTAAPGQAYYYTVKAFNPAGESAAGNEASATPALAAPQDVAATASGTRITVSWAAAAGASGYDLYRAVGTNPMDFAAAPHMSVLTGTSHADGGLALSTAYRYVVKAK